MNSNSTSRLQELFHAALEFPASERAPYLDRVCGDDAALRAQLDDMLRIDAETADLTLPPMLPALGGIVAAAAPPASRQGQRVGAYELRDLLGQGGMGSVYRAIRVDGSLEQVAAIKLVRRDLLTTDTQRRFQLERQLMANLDHPNIARLLDAGDLDDGTPYVVMEYIQGRPLDRYCREHGLDIAAKVALLRRVAGAVAAAHRRLIVHRDLKPANLLVDPQGSPKLLDFGIAKPLDAAALDAEQTGTAQRYFSPLYAAPEQLTGAPVGVACDVYGLGLLLYEVLAGARPYDFDGLSAAEVERLVLHTPPPPPSVRRLARGDADARREARALRGELDGIVLRCLRKAPAERYASAEQLEIELDNFLEGRPLIDRGGHRWYRLAKFVRRHRGAVAACTAVAVSMAIGAAAYVNQAQATRRERDRAQATVGFLQDAFTAADPAKSLSGDVRVRQILDAARLRLDDLEDSQPDLFASFAGTIAETQLNVGLSPQAVDLSERALAAARRADAPPTEVALAALRSARALIRTEKFDDAEQRIALAKSLGAAELPEWAAVNARLLTVLRKPREALTLLEATLDRVSTRAPTDELATQLHWMHSDALCAMADYAGCLASVERTLAWQRTRLSDDHPRVMFTRIRRVNALGKLDRTEDALAESQGLAEAVDRVYGRESAFSASVHNGYGNILNDHGDLSDAIEQFRIAVSASQKSLGPEHKDTLRSRYNLAFALSRSPTGEGEAEALYAELQPLFLRRFGASDDNFIMVRLSRGQHLIERKRFAEALAVLLPEGMDDASAVFGTFNRDEYRKTLTEAVATDCTHPRTSSVDVSTLCRRAAALVRPP